MNPGYPTKDRLEVSDFALREMRWRAMTRASFIGIGFVAFGVFMMLRSEDGSGGLPLAVALAGFPITGLAVTPWRTKPRKQNQTRARTARTHHACPFTGAPSLTASGLRPATKRAIGAECPL